MITGSNANLLSGKLATLLSGRYVEIKLYPLSFKEFLQAKNIDPQSRMVEQLYREYEQYGTFPSVVLSDERLKDTILSGIFDSIVLNEIAYRANVKDTQTLKSVIAFGGQCGTAGESEQNQQYVNFRTNSDHQSHYQ